MEVRGITATSLVTLGQTVIQVAGHPVIFHVVDDLFILDRSRRNLRIQIFRRMQGSFGLRAKAYQVGKYLYSFRYKRKGNRTETKFGTVYYQHCKSGDKRRIYSKNRAN